jgi:hypothetical protein
MGCRSGQVGGDGSGGSRDFPDIVVVVLAQEVGRLSRGLATAVSSQPVTGPPLAVMRPEGFGKQLGGVGPGWWIEGSVCAAALSFWPGRPARPTNQRVPWCA